MKDLEPWPQAGRQRLLPNGVKAIPRLSKAGMPSRSEGWGGLFKDPRSGSVFNRCASRIFIRSALRADFEQLLMFRPIGLTLRAALLKWGTGVHTRPPFEHPA